ncbi:MAG TPA: DUF4249 family protein [Candidatus Kryptonia bacterium]
MNADSIYKAGGKLRGATAVLLAVLSILSSGCNSPFKPDVNITPKLVVYSILIANSKDVYVRVTSVKGSQSDSVGEPVHGATVVLSGGSGPDITLIDTTGVIDGDTVSFYFVQTEVMPFGNYTLSVLKNGYPPAVAPVSVPGSNVTVPDLSTYSDLRRPAIATTPLVFNVLLSGSTRAEFARLYVEYRGFDSSGNFQSDIIPINQQTSPDPFREATAGNTDEEFSISDYASAFKSAQALGGNLKRVHFYTDIVVTQIDDPLYRFYITSNRELDPLSMRTDKIIFSNIFNGLGEGIVAGAAVDTTRIFLF